MILFFKSWCENIIVGVVISVIIEMICPERFLKYIKIVIGVYILYLIIAPILDKLNLEMFNSFIDDIDTYVNSDLLIEEEIEEKLSNYNLNNDDLNETFIKGIEIKVKDVVKEELGVDVSIDIEYDKKSFEINRVEVKRYRGVAVGNDVDNKLINNIILKEIDIDEKLIVYD